MKEKFRRLLDAFWCFLSLSRIWMCFESRRNQEQDMCLFTLCSARYHDLGSDYQGQRRLLNQAAEDLLSNMCECETFSGEERCA
jgi:hypothetical protein